MEVKISYFLIWRKKLESSPSLDDIIIPRILFLVVVLKFSKGILKYFISQKMKAF